MSDKPAAEVGGLVSSRYRRWLGVARLAGYAGRPLVAAALLLNLVTGLLPISFVIWIGIML